MVAATRSMVSQWLMYRVGLARWRSSAAVGVSVGVVGGRQRRWSARSRMRGEKRRPVRSNRPKMRSVYPAVSVVCSWMVRSVSLSNIASST